MSVERQGSYEGLPPIRSDLRFDSFDTEACRALMQDRLIVLSNFFSPPESESIRKTVRNILTLHAPVRIVRKVLNKVFPEQAYLPKILRRKPLSVDLNHQTLFLDEAKAAVEKVQKFNSSLYQHPTVAAVYGANPHDLTDALFVRTRIEDWFAEHQDSQGVRGFGYAMQTDRTLWRISPGKTNLSTPDFCFETFPGDLVVLRERAGELDASDPLVLGQGFDNFADDGSMVHTGLNLADRVRYTLNLFSVQYKEQ